MTPFFLLSGAGNDFLALAEPERLPTTREIRAWCRRGLSIGADGLFVLRRSGPSSPGKDSATVEMEYFNADGETADLCLNGTRCAARLAFTLGWAERRVCVATGAGSVHAEEIDSTTVRLEDAPLPAAAPHETAVRAAREDHRGFRVRVGVPHFVLAVPHIEEAPVATLGPVLRAHPAFGPEGTNVDFVETTGPSLLALRTYERGVEAETLACGTGVLAAVAVGLSRQRLRLPVRVRTRGGFELEVAGAALDGALQSWSLTGDARLLAKGEILADAAVEPRLGAFC